MWTERHPSGRCAAPHCSGRRVTCDPAINKPSPDPNDRAPQADRFRDGAVRVKRKLWWQNCKMKIVVALAVILLAVVIFLLVCFSGGNCLK